MWSRELDDQAVDAILTALNDVRAAVYAQAAAQERGNAIMQALIASNAELAQEVQDSRKALIEAMRAGAGK